MHLEGLCAVTVTFNPSLDDGRLRTQLEQLRGKVDLHVVVDNGSANVDYIRKIIESQPQEAPAHLLLALRANFGIGRALNEGVAACLRNTSTRWILTLDQDTMFSEGAFSTLAGELEQIPRVAEAGIIAFNYLEHRFNRTRPYNHSRGPALAKSVITSGSIVSRRLLERVPFDEELFLYYVDVDFCHRSRRLGFPIYILRHAFIDHQEGRETLRGAQTFHYLDPPRLYFVCRNGIRVFRRYGTAKALLVASYLVMMNLLGGTSRRQSIRFAFHGFLASFWPGSYPQPFGESPR
ncbi:MAG: glycosyltransferase [Thermoplasmata archaeon]|nr:glycosyltransferase [Thermoplasmata archaeon]